LPITSDLKCKKGDIKAQLCLYCIVLYHWLGIQRSVMYSLMQMVWHTVVKLRGV